MLKLIFYRPLRFMYLITLAFIICHADKSQCKLKLRTDRERDGKKKIKCDVDVSTESTNSPPGHDCSFNLISFCNGLILCFWVWQDRPCLITGKRRSTKTGPQRGREIDKNGKMEVRFTDHKKKG